MAELLNILRVQVKAQAPVIHGALEIPMTTPVVQEDQATYVVHSKVSTVSNSSPVTASPPTPLDRLPSHAARPSPTPLQSPPLQLPHQLPVTALLLPRHRPPPLPPPHWTLLLAALSLSSLPPRAHSPLPRAHSPLPPLPPLPPRAHSLLSASSRSLSPLCLLALSLSSASSRSHSPLCLLSALSLPLVSVLTPAVLLSPLTPAALLSPLTPAGAPLTPAVSFVLLTLRVIAAAESIVVVAFHCANVHRPSHQNRKTKPQTAQTAVRFGCDFGGSRFGGGLENHQTVDPRFGCGLVVFTTKPRFAHP
ncbi:hypothetical protein Syun_027686 [Stephania yunnanensis]|uniref:Uncharacterized protein n=1 Tax=Stephania yunnanensis TaxID=152371 RepID=A0AAP0HRH3_9MAGN